MSVFQRAMDRIVAREREEAAALRAARSRIAALEADVALLRRRGGGTAAYEDVSAIQGALDAWAGGATMPWYLLEGIALQDADTVLANPAAHPKRVAVMRMVQAARLAGRDLNVASVRNALANG
jgi:hypothetical protein